MRIGSFFSGAGGLDMAVEEVFGGEVIWQSEVDKAASKVLAYHWPDVPNVGDVNAVNWSNWKPVLQVDVLCGGFPCQDVSLAGRRAGLDGARSGLWSVMAEATAALAPQWLVVENVMGLVKSGLNTVLKDIAAAGYSALWTVFPAAAVGAPHKRRRVFIVARRADGLATSATRIEIPAPEPAGKLLPTPEAKNAHAGQDFARADRVNSGGDDLVTAVIKGYPSRWAQYRPALEHWATILGRPAPDLSEPTSTGNPRIHPAFVEWLMGWPAGWVTAVPGEPTLFGEPESALHRSDQLRICGNGVVPQQAEAAIQHLIKEMQ